MPFKTAILERQFRQGRCGFRRRYGPRKKIGGFSAGCWAPLADVAQRLFKKWPAISQRIMTDHRFQRTDAVRGARGPLRRDVRIQIDDDAVPAAPAD